MDSIPERHLYTCCLRETTLSSNLQIDGFLLQVFIQRRDALIKGNDLQNVGVLCGITREAYPTDKWFYVPRPNILSGDRIPFSRMLCGLGLPVEEHGKLVAGICDLAATMASQPDNTPPKLLRMKIEIDKWSTVNIPNDLAGIQPVVVESGESSSNSDDECSICFEPLSSGPEAIELSCRHKYHLHCVILWVSINSNCPVCRFEIPVVPHIL